MSTTIAMELEHSRKRLNYYLTMRDKSGSNSAIERWIAIYSERIKKLERQSQKIDRIAVKRRPEMSSELQMTV
ncbi:MAG: hypothetical protein AAB116_08165 [Candidatus Poribacteria bacterium]